MLASRSESSTDGGTSSSSPESVARGYRIAHAPSLRTYAAGAGPAWQAPGSAAGSRCRTGPPAISYLLFTRVSTSTDGGRIVWEAIREELQSVDQQIGDSLARLIGTLPALLVAILVVAVFVLIARLARRLLAGVSRVSRLDPMLRGLFDQLLTAAIVVFGVAVGLGVLGIDARTIIASFGVAGLIVGFALKDLLENFISGILILWRRPFRVLDHIQVGASEGIVEEITRSEEHTSELQSRENLVCRLL